ncbi:MAG: hypothetical protein EZS28_027482 [Streblomastix strix]|uniref:Uncharacterized protein n=1 Tax=Streblomastix strix TaxID=222440 RepID=A0A5J4V3D6_9EUKA|nr:MAG: hypothetical protein EZS28_027482 [Streblomastix strix]
MVFLNELQTELRVDEGEVEEKGNEEEEDEEEVDDDDQDPMIMKEEESKELIVVVMIKIMRKEIKTNFLCCHFYMNRHSKCFSLKNLASRYLSSIYPFVVLTTLFGISGGMKHECVYASVGIANIEHTANLNKRYRLESEQDSCVAKNGYKVKKRVSLIDESRMALLDLVNTYGELNYEVFGLGENQIWEGVEDYYQFYEEQVNEVDNDSFNDDIETQYYGAGDELALEQIVSF